LLKSQRQQYHLQIAHVLEERFPEIRDTQPELLAHHYTEASLIEPAIPYWQQAGQRASQRSAHAEAISPSPLPWSCSSSCRTLWSAASKNSPCKLPWACH
jgi:hypothetical protein